MTHRHTRRPLRALSEWEHQAEPRPAVPLMLVTATCLLWWTVSLVLSPVWLALRKPEHGLLDDIWSVGDDR